MSREYEVESKFNKRYGLVSRRLMGLLSEDARTSIAEASKALNVSRPTVKAKLQHLENELDLKYTLELNEAALGLNSPHIIAVKFGKTPNYNKVKAILERSYIPQVVFSTKGDYDMVIYANARSGGEYAQWDKAMRILLGEYKATWQPSEIIHKQLCFFPLRNEIINKTIADPKLKLLLTTLNANSRLSFQQLSKITNMHFNTVKYNYDKLISSGYVIRPTITMSLPKDICFVSWFSNYSPTTGYESASAKGREAVFSDDENPIINRYLITASLIGTYDLFSIDVFDDKAAAYKYDLDYHKSLFVKHGIRMTVGEVKEVLLGRLPIRSVNTKKEFKKIAWTTEFT